MEVNLEDPTVKTEGDYGQQILLFYVDENGENEQSIVTTINDIQQQNIPIDETQQYYIEESTIDSDSENKYIVMDAGDGNDAVLARIGDSWTETEAKRLLVFYIDNKETFLKGITREKFLWSVACRTMLPGKTPIACKTKLDSLRDRYFEIIQMQSLQVSSEQDVQWPYFVLAHQAFHDEIVYRNAVCTHSEFLIEDPNDKRFELLQTKNKIRKSNAHEKHILIRASNYENTAKEVKIIENVSTSSLEDGGEENKALEIVSNAGQNHVNFNTDAVIIKHETSQLIGTKYDPVMQVVFSNEPTTVVAPVRRSRNASKADPTVLAMLNLYLKLKETKSNDQKAIFERIADNMRGENDADYWHKRFLNYRNHYIKLLEQYNKEPSEVTWPYMEIFNKIFRNDEQFHKKYNFGAILVNKNKESNLEKESANNYSKKSKQKWTRPEKVILVKHYFDCYSEHQDKTLPKSFLWSEIGRTLNIEPAECKSKYEELRIDHLMSYINRSYTKHNRDALTILFDYIISMDVENQISKLHIVPTSNNGTFNSDALVQFIHDYIDIFKDKMCYYVCWAAIALQLKHSLLECLSNWYGLKALYKSLLYQKKNQPDSKVEWKYIQMFDEIFDFGANMPLLIGYENLANKDVEIDVAALPNDKKQTKRNDKDNIKDREKMLSMKSTQDSVKGTSDTACNEKWSQRDIKALLDFYANNRMENYNDMAAWKTIAKKLGKTEKNCCQKFLKLKKSYLEFKEGNSKNIKGNLEKYYDVLDKILNESDDMEIDANVTGNCNSSTASKEKEQRNIKSSGEKVRCKKWNLKSRELLLTLYLRYVKTNRNKIIDSQKLWKEISIKLNKNPQQCKKMFVKLKRLNNSSIANSKYKGLIDEILSIKPKVFRGGVSKKRVEYKNVDIPNEKLEIALEYYFKNLEDLLSVKFNKKVTWRLFSDSVGVPIYKLYQKIHFLKANYNALESPFALILNLILEKENEILKSDLKLITKRGRNKSWVEEDVRKLFEYYLEHKDIFTDKKFSRRYLWHEAGIPLKRGYKECLKVFCDVKSKYLKYVENKSGKVPEGVPIDICQKMFTA